MRNKMEDVENDVTLPRNIEVDMCPDDTYGVPYISVFHRESDNDDTVIFSLHDGTIIDGYLSDDEETEIMSQWVYENKDQLLTAWQNKERKNIVQSGDADVL